MIKRNVALLLAAALGGAACTPDPVGTSGGGDDVGDGAPAPPVADAGPTSNRVVDGLVARYDFDGVAGGAVVADTSGVGVPLDLAIGNPDAVTWGDGMATLLGGPQIASAGPATKIHDACVASNAITVEAWIRPTAESSNGRVVSSSSDGGNRNFQIKQQNTGYAGRIRTTNNNDGTQPQSNTAAGTASIAAVQHVVTARLAGGGQDAWVDGVKQPPISNGGSLSTWDASFGLSIGADGDGANPWDGEVYLVAIYCRALTPAEVRQNFDEGY